ncbi:MAG: hypothetical protein RMK29_05900 [Myxococcales bacterium]|nr:hypothetical protein [Myxococcota bacterium]MDW8281223.1 hypothetical protein [Myxococcales bacterium]
MSSRRIVRTPRLPRTAALRSACFGGPLRPVLRGQPLPSTPRTLAAMVQTVIAAVNARGLCAASAARLAELPAEEVAGIAALCRCPACWALRAQ